jgi:fructose-1,6-bisphosphatase/sedoheptulose 1,7-bisphosphatase-like protein
MLDGVRWEQGFVTTESLVMISSNRSVRRVRMRRPA